jgi:hypothetical protein
MHFLGAEANSEKSVQAFVRIRVDSPIFAVRAKYTILTACKLVGYFSSLLIGEYLYLRLTEACNHVLVTNKLRLL